MKTLVMDTSWKHLVIGLFEDGKLIAGVDEEAMKKQSEWLFVRLEQLLEKAGWKLADLDEVVITDGPGSYTGLRIAMTAAKIIGSQKKIPVRTLSLMQLYAGLDPNACVLLDARGKRVYAARTANGEIEWMGILPIEQAAEFADGQNRTLYGEGELIGRKAADSDFLQAFESLLPLARPVEDIDTLVPCYLKESDSYKV